jgi:hypothetical protein
MFITCSNVIYCVCNLQTPFAKKLPLIVFGVLSIIGGLFALPLPETRNRPLPDTVSDVENYEEFCKKHLHMNVNGNDLNTPTQEEPPKDSRV